jgi:predicted enzyme related to lactoylglutathione lyase
MAKRRSIDRRDDGDHAGDGTGPTELASVFYGRRLQRDAEKASATGGKLMVPPTDIPNVGRFSVVQDPQGAVFAIIKLTGPHAN